MVSPIRPGPIKKGSENPNVAPVPSAVFFGRQREGHGHIFYNRQ